MLRTTAAEALLEEYKKSAEDRIKAAERVIEGLRKENESLRRKAESGPAKSARVSDVSAVSADQANGLRPIVDLYGRLSGLEILSDLETENLWHCSINGRQGDFTFDLSFEEEERQYSYVPTFSTKMPISSRLPAYLQEEIVFDCDQLQLFFWRALNFLMSTPVASNNK
jgi:hypothetical protein